MRKLQLFIALFFMKFNIRRMFKTENKKTKKKELMTPIVISLTNWDRYIKATCDFEVVEKTSSVKLVCVDTKYIYANELKALWEHMMHLSWWKGFTFKEFCSALSLSNCFIIARIHSAFDASELLKEEVTFNNENSIHIELVGFVRVTTDRHTIGIINDVFVLPKYRSRGFGSILLQYVLNSKKFASLKKFALWCSKDTSYYYINKFNFKKLDYCEIVEYKKQS